jgi:REP element-mobilizing transposase RayT
MRSRKRNDFEKHGDLFFVTSSVVGFVKLFKLKSLCDIMIQNLDYYQKRGDFTIIAYVIMPDHFHLIIKTNKGLTVSQCIGNYKRITSRKTSLELEKAGNKMLLSSLGKGAMLEPTSDSRVWEYRFDSLVITNEDTLRQKIEYIHNNPVKAGLVSEPTAWPYSSARNYAGLDDVLIPIDVEWRCLDYGMEPSGRGS